jgi:hypothetical protein
MLAVAVDEPPDEAVQGGRVLVVERPQQVVVGDVTGSHTLSNARCPRGGSAEMCAG